MRPTTSIMLQQNNNNNYPCLNVSGSGREMLQKCSRASLPFPSRLELGLGDLPLIRGLRAWALCSKNRCKAGGLLGGGQAPAAPPVGRGSSTPCPRPADVYLSGEWGRMGYGLPLGLDSRQAGIGALVTVATLKTSEGGGKTQTQCLVLRTEKGNCLYPTAKPGSGGAAGASSGVVGGWLRGKTGGRDTPAGRRDNGPALPAQTGTNRVRVRSGRRWRKSSNTAGREKTGVSRERRQRSREDPAGERQEERDKGGLDGKAFPGPQQDGRRARPEREGACRSPRCCHRVSPRSCPQCGRRAQRKESQDDGGGGESPRAGFSNGLSGEGRGMRRERRKNEEEEKEGVVESESSDSVLAAPNPDLESNRSHPRAPGGRDGEEVRGADSSEELKTQSSQSEDDHSEKERDSDSENMKTRTGNTGFILVRAGQLTGDFKSRNNREPAVEAAADVNRLPDEESEKPTDGAEVEVDERSVSQAPAELPLVSNRYQDVSAPASPASVGAAVRPESSAPPGGSTCAADHEARWVKRGREDGGVEHVEGRHRGQDDPRRTGKQELDVSRSEPQEPSCVADGSNTVKPPFFYENEGNNVQLVEREAMSSPVRRGRPYVFETDGRRATENSCDRRTAEPERRDGPGSVEERAEERLNPEGGAEEIGGRKRTCSEPDTGDGKGHGDKERHSEEETVGTVREEDYKEVRRKHAPQDNGGPQGSGEGHRGRGKTDGDTCTETSTTRLEENGEAGARVSDVARADPSRPPPLSPANPVASLAPLGSMATGRPRPEEEEEQEEEEEGGLAATAGAGSREGKRGYGRELEEQGQEERGPIVAAVEGRKKAEEEEEEEQEEEDEFGVFMQAEGEPAWSKGFTMSASVPCGSRESAAPVITGQPSLWTPGWTTDGGSSGGSDGSSDDAWTAFPQDPTDKGREVVGLWWPTSAAEEAKEGRPSANRNLASVFAEAFPSPPGSPGDPGDPEAVPTLTRLLGGRTGQDQGLLDGFHDLNKMIGQRYKRASGVSRDLLLRTLHLQQSQNECRPAPWTASRRLSPGLPSANQHAQNAAAKRRLSYDHSRDTAE